MVRMGLLPAPGGVGTGSVSLLRTMLVVGVLYSILSCCGSFLIFLACRVYFIFVFIKAGWILPNAFAASVEMIMCFLSLVLSH